MTDSFSESEAKRLASSAIDRTLQALYEPISTEIGVLSAKLGERFFPYSKHSLERCMNVRTMDSPHLDRRINEFYVSPTFRLGSSTYTAEFVTKEVESGKRVVISGQGGSGKTIFLKYLFLYFMTKGSGSLPLMIELRKLNRGEYSNLNDLCRSSLDLRDGVPGSVFSTLCKRGFFTFILDGFDEVSRKNRVKVEAELLDLARTYPRCGFVVSGRKNAKFQSWEGFSQYKICDLTRDEVLEVVEKSIFPSSLKGQIRSEILDQDFFKKHSSLLATPLLVTMLLITYQRTSRLPLLLSNFYPQVFDTLVFLHDSRKETFARDFSMSTEQFRRFFGVFCLISYLKEVYEFDGRKLEKFILDATAYGAKTDILHGVDGIPASEIKIDLNEASNLLIFDDGVYTFLHRSMQEYFAAEAALSIEAAKIPEVIRIFSERRSDSAFKFAYELSESRVVESYIIPRLKHLDGCVDLLHASPEDILNSLAPRADIFMRPYENGYCDTYAGFENSDLIFFLDALDSISELGNGIVAIQSAFHAKIRAASHVRVPKKFLSEGNFKICVSWRSGEPRVENYETLDRKKFTESEWQKIQTVILDKIYSAYMGQRKEILEYLGHMQHRIQGIVELRNSRECSIDELLGL